MAWQDELLPGSYRNINFVTQSHSITNGKKGGEHDKPQQDGGSREDLGNSMRSISVTCFVSGDNYKTARDTLETALNETGSATLQLPTRDPINAIPTGWTVAESSINDGGNARFSITFLEVTGELAPTLSNSQQAIVTKEISDNIETIGQAFENSLVIESNADLNSVLSYFDVVDDYIDFYVGSIMPDNLISKYNEIKAVINANIQRLLQVSPITLASLYHQFINLIAEDVINAPKIIDGQIKLIDNMLSTFPYANIKNSLKRTQSTITEMIINSAIDALSTVANEFDYQNRPEAQSIINQILDGYNNSVEGLQDIEALFFDQNSDKQFRLNQEAAQNIDDIVSRTVQSIIQRSYTLATERTYSIENDRTIIDLCHEIYGNIDNIDNIVAWNSLNNPLLLVEGQSVVYYI